VGCREALPPLGPTAGQREAWRFRAASVWFGVFSCFFSVQFLTATREKRCLKETVTTRSVKAAGHVRGVNGTPPVAPPWRTEKKPQRQRTPTVNGPSPVRSRNSLLCLKWLLL